MTEKLAGKVREELEKIKEAQKKLAEIYFILDDGDEIQVFCKAHNAVYHGIQIYIDVLHGDLEKHLRRDH